MLEQRRFVLFIFIGVIFVLSTWVGSGRVSSVFPAAVSGSFWPLKNTADDSPTHGSDDTSQNVDVEDLEPYLHAGQGHDAEVDTNIDEEHGQLENGMTAELPSLITPDVMPTDTPTSGHDMPHYESDEFGGPNWFFQEEVPDYPNPHFDVAKLKTYKPHNYQGQGHATYATFLSTRNSSLQDPYFLATQQITYRLLWGPMSRSAQYPVTIFVAPYIGQAQRSLLLAAGAIVKDLELIEWHPSHATTAEPRWREMFSKLNFWKQTDFSRMLYLDADAFPLVSMDELFDAAERQRCNAERIEGEDLSNVDEICDYVFTAVGDVDDGINAGMMILEPNLAMHSRLIRESAHSDEYNQNMVEQAFLTHAFSSDGPFPVQYVDRKWNALFTTNDDEGKINVIHEKLWAFWLQQDHFAAIYFRENWDEMLQLYNSPEFLAMRAADGVVEHHSVS